MSYSKEAIAAALASAALGRPLYFFASLGSTNVEARRLAAAGAGEGTLVVADEQTAGRGRADRRWLTPAGRSLAATFILRPNWDAASAPRLSLLGGLAAALAIEAQTGLPTALKWPNDVWIGERKVCGVLPETSLSQRAGGRVDWVALGIGVNVNGAPPAAQAMRQPATTLQAELQQPVDRVALLARLATTLAALYFDFDSGNLIREWEGRLLWRERPVLARVGATSIKGILRGLTPGGALQIQTNSGEIRQVIAGEIVSL